MLIALVVFARLGLPQTDFVRVSQVGYEAGEKSSRAYLMTKAPVNGERFNVVNSKGVNAYTGAVGALLGTWAHSKTVT
ncbi:MAG: hypothetical protein WBD45_22390, partial [Terriglobales bacterium]